MKALLIVVLLKPQLLDERGDELFLFIISHQPKWRAHGKMPVFIKHYYIIYQYT